MIFKIGIFDKIFFFAIKTLLFILFFVFILSKSFDFILNEDSHLVIISYYLLMSISLIFLMSERRISLFSVFYLFSFIFFSYVPYLEYINGIVYWTHLEFTDDDYLYTNILILVMIIIVRIGEFFSWRFISNKKFNIEIVAHGGKTLTVMVFISFLCLYLSLYANSFDISSMLFRGAAQSSKYTPVNLIINNFSRFVTLLLFLSVYFSKSNVVIKLIFFVIALFCSFPMSMPRYFVAAIYIPIIWAIISTFHVKQSLIYYILFAFVTIFPLLDNARRIDNLSDYTFIYSMEFFLAGHFDSYQTLVRVIQQDIITNWNQLIGNLLFFIPRDYWDEKPYGSGYFLADTLDYTFKNISMNYFAEGYVNRGYLGVFIFLIALISFMHVADKMYHKPNSRAGKFSFIVFFGIFIMVMRGDLLTVFSILFSYFFSFIFCYMLVRKL